MGGDIKGDPGVSGIGDFDKARFPSPFFRRGDKRGEVPVGSKGIPVNSLGLRGAGEWVASPVGIH
jgi:hypothetical protein